MPGASWFSALDALYASEGGLCQKLAALQEEGLSYKKMEARILAEKGISPSASALQRYVTGECGQ